MILCLNSIVIDVRSDLDPGYVWKLERTRFSGRLIARHKNRVRHQNTWPVHLLEIAVS